MTRPLAGRAPAARPRVGRAERLLLGTTTVAWLFLLLTFALVTPAFGAPDEPAHVDAAFRLALGLGWPHAGDMHYLAAIRQIVEHPVPAVDRTTVDALLAAVPGDSPAIDPMSQNPPTYWLVAAGILRLIRFGAHDWATSILVLRVFDVLLVTALPVLVWATVRRVTRSPKTALVAPLLLFAVPQLAQVASGVTVWAPVILLGAVLVWASTRVLTGDRSWWTTVFLAVAVTGLAALNAVGLLAVPFAVLVLLLPGRGRHRTVGTDATDGTDGTDSTDSTDGTGGTVGTARPRGQRLLHAGVVVVAAAAVSGWWWVRTLLVSGTLVPDALRAVTTVQPYPAGGANPGAFAGRQWDGLTASFFGDFGADQWPLPPTVIDALAIVALVVIGWSYARRTQARRVSTVVLVWPALVLAATLAYNWRNYLGTHQGNGLQGRFLFVAVVALVLAQAVAWHALIVRPELRRRLARVAAVVSFAIATYGVGLTYRGAWESSQFRVTYGGISAMAGGALTGPYPIALALGVFVLAAVTTVVLLWRATDTTTTTTKTTTTTTTTTNPAPTPAPTATTTTTATATAAHPGAHPDDGPLESPPTHEPTVRKETS
ncbi:glycosyltransferase family 39 protein [Curtobacterium sp. PhB115]|uniref:glycosyltransferase family 39 protein n=1 Tax=Curtobacterium sp. PhB115 TaxID=2485173 RepID=UPI000F4CD51F|nr:glycosyltransferase family 39 protein [Curtobacterium sp. PhB115]ROP64323.1 dolichyl-phosphate-mannose-protein mannosyltransferase [Curtobacterium sp. PhB115]